MSSNTTEQIKKMLISEQQPNAPEAQLIEAIIDGRVKLLSDKDIYQKLNISETEFSEWVKQTTPNYQAEHRTAQAVAVGVLFRDYSTKMSPFSQKKQHSFPKPDIYIAGKARWTTDTLRNWLRQNTK